MRQVHDPRFRMTRQDDPFHDAYEGIGFAEIGQEDDGARHTPIVPFPTEAAAGTSPSQGTVPYFVVDIFDDLSGKIDIMNLRMTNRTPP